MLTGSGTGSKVRAAAWAADCQILAATKTIAIAQGSMSKMSNSSLCSCEPCLRDAGYCAASGAYPGAGSEATDEARNW